jgi:hypothetical protein
VILGIEIRATACGWSLLDETASSFVGLGVHALGRTPRPDRSTLSQIDRGHCVARVLAARAPGCTTVVLERWVPEAVGELDVGLAWGAVLGVAAMLTPRPRLLTVEPHRWQREVLLGRHAVGDDQAYANAAYVLRGHAKAEEGLRRLAAHDREPAIAAAMIALYGSLRLAKPKRAAAEG